MSLKYLHVVPCEAAAQICYLDHRLCTEVQSMMVSMVSRMPEGGVSRRYAELVDKIAQSLLEEEDSRLSLERKDQRDQFVASMGGSMDTASRIPIYRSAAEDRLCEYPLHPIVAEHFRKWVGEYGHSSITEHNAEPMVFLDGCSRWLAWLLFDNPLVSGQEASTRALDFGKRPPCPEVGDVSEGTLGEELLLLHRDWMALRDAELEWWKADLVQPCGLCGGVALDVPCTLCKGTGKKHPWMLDPQPFRPAFDRSRWALPGSISTGCAFSYSLRAASRSLANAWHFAKESGNQPAMQILDSLYSAFWAAAPGLAPLVLKKPAGSGLAESWPHLSPGFVGQSHDVELDLVITSHLEEEQVCERTKPRNATRRAYLDPKWNQLVRVNLILQCSLAAATDWHRHRTGFPWQIDIVDDSSGLIVIDHHYRPHSLDESELTFLRRRTTSLYREFLEKGDRLRAILCLPLGTRVQMSTSMGLRDFVYMTELRGYVAGANFEYLEQAQTALRQLGENLTLRHLGWVKRQIGLHLSTKALTRQAQ